MVGSSGERVLSIALPHVDTWNTWFDWYGNTPEGFAARNAEIDAAAERAGRDPTRDRAQRVRARGAGPHGGRTSDRPDDIPRSKARPNGSRRVSREMAEAGADEVILVVTPIDRSIDPSGSADVLALTRDAANR